MIRNPVFLSLTFVSFFPASFTGEGSLLTGTDGLHVDGIDYRGLNHSAEICGECILTGESYTCDDVAYVACFIVDRNKCSCTIEKCQSIRDEFFFRHKSDDVLSKVAPLRSSLDNFGKACLTAAKNAQNDLEKTSVCVFFERTVSAIKDKIVQHQRSVVRKVQRNAGARSGMTGLHDRGAVSGRIPGVHPAREDVPMTEQPAQDGACAQGVSPTLPPSETQSELGVVRDALLFFPELEKMQRDRALPGELQGENVHSE
ncbi:MAG: hypothetical protein LBJ89_00280 [Holosporales bacterium]|jgi:hypothetical protein|nr:hypothetical protein [Holosporales bacterium]